MGNYIKGEQTMNNVVIIGRAVREVEMKYTQGGLAVANITLAVDRSMSKAKKEEAQAKGEPTADFIRVVAFSHTAEFLGNYLGKGKMVAVNGRIQTGSYEDKDGKRVYTTDVIANDVKILEWKDDNKKQGFEIEGFSPTNDDVPF